MAAVFRTVRVVISGQVQGVWYRGWTVESARALDLCGWVRNRRDGTVEAVFGGPERAIEIMLARCHSGPPAVTDMNQVISPTAGCPDRFGFSGGLGW